MQNICILEEGCTEDRKETDSRGLRMHWNDFTKQDSHMNENYADVWNTVFDTLYIRNFAAEWLALLFRMWVGWPPFVDDFAGHPVLPTHLPDRIVNVIGGSYTHVHTLPHPRWHKAKYTKIMAMNKQREV
jgi:hypothetical protein